MFEVDLTKFKKYDKPGPRYTSYPTAPQFHEKFTHKDFLDEIFKTNNAETKAPLSLYFHLPYCDTLCYFCGCNMIITRNRDRIREYINYIKKEIDLFKKYLSEDRIAVQHHWGGGTPTHLFPDEINDLASYINSKFQFADNSEISCEIDPRELKQEHLEALKNNGFNRISMGVQDFDENVQKAVNRIQTEDISMQAINWIRTLEFQSLNLDLIYGLPHQTVKSFEKTVDRVIDISPDRIAVFNYAHVPWMKKHMSLINPDDIPVPEVKLEILKMTIEKLTSSGYVFIGMDHFAKPNDELSIALKEKKLYRNFQGYSTHAGTDLYALGITSISQLKNIYAQNYKTEKEYYTALNENIFPTAKGYYLTEDDQIRREVIMKLMCDFELDFEYIESKYQIYFKEYFKWGLSNLKEMIDDQLLQLSDSGIKINHAGKLLIRNIAINFDGFIERQQDKARYSRTI